MLAGGVQGWVRRGGVSSGQTGADAREAPGAVVVERKEEGRRGRLCGESTAVDVAYDAKTKPQQPNQVNGGQDRVVAAVEVANAVEPLDGQRQCDE